MILQHKFIELLPPVIEEGVLYISLEYCSAIHKCVCGCGNKVITPISPTEWEITFDGKSVSLYPSIGNWSFECKSHYWITKSKVKFARMWSDKEIADGKNEEAKLKAKYFRKRRKKK